MAKKVGRTKLGEAADRDRVNAEIAEAHRRGESAAKIAPRYGISRGMVSRIIRRSKARLQQVA